MVKNRCISNKAKLIWQFCTVTCNAQMKIQLPSHKSKPTQTLSNFSLLKSGILKLLYLLICTFLDFYLMWSCEQYMYLAVFIVIA